MESDFSLTNVPWMAKANCKGLTPVFFPPNSERPQARERREALARTICAGCAVIQECRDYAYNNNEYGFWGGESEDERRGHGAKPFGRKSTAQKHAEAQTTSSSTVD